MTGQAEQAPGNVLIGFACDAGVVRNHGRAGAAGGPAAVRKLLVNCAWHQTHPVYDGGNVLCEGDALEAAQFVLGTHVAAVLEAGHLPLVIGGGHEVGVGQLARVGDLGDEAAGAACGGYSISTRTSICARVKWAPPARRSGRSPRTARHATGRSATPVSAVARPTNTAARYLPGRRS